ncbi:hypothetical protein [Streptomyces sp. NPDC014006]|uniref:hypothetical protein n=1 Tax=Streptomyces sp. NPDC014006 TaxID=3364870 RepID=UPI0036F8E6C6
MPAQTGMPSKASRSATSPPPPAVPPRTVDPTKTDTRQKKDPLRATPEEIAEAKAAEAYWTPERIANAVPVDLRKGPAAEGGRTKAPPTLDKLMRASSAYDNRGVATAGVFLINDDDDPQSDPGKRDEFCSASSVSSPTESLIITAAHCLNDNDRFKSLAFAPGWKPDPSHQGRGIAPYGIFPIKSGKIWIDGRYLSQGPAKADDLDFAILRSGPNSKGQFAVQAVARMHNLALAA